MSLLAKFFNQIKSSQEDIASDGLKYILQNSVFAQKYIKTLLFSKTGIEIPELRYTSQLVKQELGRTDISGLDISGNEILIIEAKFWASLTENQPVSYIERLGENSVLLFLCPTLRKNSLFIELKKKLSEQNIAFGTDDEEKKIILKNGKYILIQSWNEILEPIKIVLKENKENGLVSDIDQIIGFCDVVDSNSFIPLSEEDLSPNFGRKVSSFYSLVDEVIAELSKHKDYRQEKLTEGKPKKEAGYYKYRYFKNLGLTFGLNFNYWAKYADTPFWVIITEKDFKQTEKLKFTLRKGVGGISNPIFEDNNGQLIYPIYPPKFLDKDGVVKSMITQIVEVYQKITEAE